MGRVRNSFRQRTAVVALPLQDLHIRGRFPHFARSGSRGEAVWTGTLQPRQSSPAYRVVIRYRIGSIPRVTVTWPQVAPSAPHRFADGTLCLYWAKEWQWRGDMIIAQTIIPWTSLWLYYYELWLDTGEWLGPSSHDLTKTQQTE